MQLILILPTSSHIPLKGTCSAEGASQIARLKWMLGKVNSQSVGTSIGRTTIAATAR